MLADVFMRARCIIYVYCPLEGRMFFPKADTYTWYAVGLLDTVPERVAQLIRNSEECGIKLGSKELSTKSILEL